MIYLCRGPWIQRTFVEDLNFEQSLPSSSSSSSFWSLLPPSRLHWCFCFVEPYSFFPLGVPYSLVPAMCLQPPSWLNISYTRPYVILCPHQLGANLCGTALFPVLLRNGSQGDLLTKLSSKNVDPRFMCHSPTRCIFAELTLFVEFGSQSVALDSSKNRIWFACNWTCTEDDPFKTSLEHRLAQRSPKSARFLQGRWMSIDEILRASRSRSLILPDVSPLLTTAGYFWPLHVLSYAQ